MNIPNERIKRCEAAVIVAANEKYDSPFTGEGQLWGALSAAIVSKLEEFRKLSIERLPDGNIRYSAHVDVIVPVGRCDDVAA